MQRNIISKELDMIRSIMFSDPVEYSSTIKENLPQVIEELKNRKKGNSSSVPNDLENVPASKMEKGLHNYLIDSGTDQKNLTPTSKDRRRIDSQMDKENPTNKASGVAKQITNEGKKFRRGAVCMDEKREDMAMEYFVLLAQDLSLTPVDILNYADLNIRKSKKSLSKLEDLLTLIEKLTEKARQSKEKFHLSEETEKDRKLVEIAEFLNPIIKDILDS
jgi:hypothetical protein